MGAKHLAMNTLQAEPVGTVEQLRQDMLGFQVNPNLLYQGRRLEPNLFIFGWLLIQQPSHICNKRKKKKTVNHTTKAK